jgi:flagellar hook assembly protein FlgD
MPKKFYLSQNYPNPFNSQTLIEYTIERTSFVQLKIFDALGKEVKTLTNRIQTPGRYRVVWDGKTNEGGDVPSGVYIYRLIAGNSRAYRKLIFLE